MATKLNKRAFEYAQERITEGRVVLDDRDAWSEHQPTTQQENEFIRSNGIDAYPRWHLGIDTHASKEAKAACKFPYGDFEKVHRCAVISAESRAGQYKHHDIENKRCRTPARDDAEMTCEAQLGTAVSSFSATSKN
jgi:hypothetical protein